MSTDNYSAEDSHGSIMRSTSVISIGTISSRVLGFFRDVILAKVLGTGMRADALFVAFKIPNLLRNFVGEGATNSAAVPVFSEYLIKKRQEFGQFVSVVLVLALILLSVITVLGVLLAPLLVRIIAPGFMANPGKLALTIQLTRMIFPYLVFIGLTAYSIAILYTFRSFKAPAFSPCLLNISIIISALFSTRYLEEPVYGLAAGIVVGGILQLVVLFPALRKTGIVFQKPRTLNHPGALRMGKLMVPRMFGAGVYQLTVLIDTFCASLAAIVGAGGISAIYYANRIIQFPMGVFTIALSSALLPTLSGFAANGRLADLKRTVIFSLKNIFFVMFPTSILMVVLSRPIIRLLFERGAFTSYSTQITSSALLFYAIGLFSFGGIKILVTAFHSLQDTKTPVKVAAVCLTINAALNFILMGPMKVGGIALASSIAATINFLVLLYVMNKRFDGIIAGWRPFLVKTLLAALFGGYVARWIWVSPFITNEIIRFVLAGLSGYFVYGSVCCAVKVEQACAISQWILRKK